MFDVRGQHNEPAAATTSDSNYKSLSTARVPPPGQAVPAETRCRRHQHLIGSGRAELQRLHPAMPGRPGLRAGNRSYFAAFVSDAGMSSSTSSPSSTAPCWLSRSRRRRLLRARREDGSSWAGSTCLHRGRHRRTRLPGRQHVPAAACDRDRAGTGAAAAARHGLRTLRAATPARTPRPEGAHQGRVRPVGPAIRPHRRKQGTWYQRDLAADAPQQRAAARTRLATDSRNRRPPPAEGNRKQDTD